MAATADYAQAVHYAADLGRRHGMEVTRVPDQDGARVIWRADNLHVELRFTYRPEVQRLALAGGRLRGLLHGFDGTQELTNWSQVIDVARFGGS